ncbi:MULTISPECIES: ACT domain-containing protein [Photobacterium]|uniref:Glycine cleavage system transcriptional repressor n=1 Tax=Photobacterium ganghwense TaxID=320778 RepID=A0A0J1H4N2_9GAMM|nr:MULTISPECIES: ACT domain-containing protein [Photobacterium]KLV06695.1 glycine cleavage system protein R [Photobacterium ganghwense]MBV1840156.1 glycine cleavage system transcriptional repressor [Photobacterium ganghwense]PSU05695.1 glycine cleavage system transcriptional repressor [Photobacterium ganghwense]QSV14704.1 glycine cleavage system transcriptional repressor [Photobacterium ganghwense]
MEHYLVVTAIGTDRPGISDEITRLITQCGCNIVDSRLAIFGREFSLLMLLSGNANAISRVESTLPLKAHEHDLLTVMKRTSKHEYRYFPYTADFHIEADDSPGLIEQFTRFFASRQIDIASLSAHTHDSTEPGVPNRFQLQIGTNLPDGCNLMTLQEEFEALCHDLVVTGSVTFIGHNQ